MSYTKLIQGQCGEYLDAQTQNSQNMLLSIINKEKCLVNPNKFNLNRSTMNPNGLQDKLKNNNDLFEGFTNGGFSGNLSGEYKIPENTCPDGHTFDGKGCRQICTHCTYKDNEPESRSINEADFFCEPFGMFNGFDNNGYIKCLSRNDKKTEYYPLDFYSADATLVTKNPLHLLESKRLY